MIAGLIVLLIKHVYQEVSVYTVSLGGSVLQVVPMLGALDNRTQACSAGDEVR